MIKTKTTVSAEAKNALEMSREVLDNSRDLNNVMTTATVVRPVFHTHFVSMDETLFGIADLISDILTQRQAVFPKGVEKTELRKVAISASLYTSEILEAVESRFTAGSVRYPLQTIKSYLSVFMSKGKGATIGKIQLKGKEDSPRPCDRPRCKWYLIEA